MPVLTTIRQIGDDVRVSRYLVSNATYAERIVIKSLPCLIHVEGKELAAAMQRRGYEQIPSVWGYLAANGFTRYYNKFGELRRVQRSAASVPRGERVGTE